MTQEKEPLFEMEPGEEEAMLLALRCFCANITSAELDRMAGDERHWFRERIGFDEAQFDAACLYVADFQKRYSEGLKILRVGLASGSIDESLVDRLQ